MSEDFTPRVTGNAVLLAGYLGGVLTLTRDPLYRVVEVEAGTATQTVEHIRSGNTYRVSVTQIGGTE